MANIEMNYYDGSTYTVLYPSTLGSLVSGAVTSANQLATARTIRTNLSSTATASFNGTANITPGVTGTLPVAYGGTGTTSLSTLASNLSPYMSSSGLTAEYGQYKGTGTTSVSITLSKIGRWYIFINISGQGSGTYANLWFIGIYTEGSGIYCTNDKVITAGKLGMIWYDNTGEVRWGTSSAGVDYGFNTSNQRYYWVTIGDPK